MLNAVGVLTDDEVQLEFTSPCTPAILEFMRKPEAEGKDKKGKGKGKGKGKKKK